MRHLIHVGKKGINTLEHEDGDKESRIKDKGTWVGDIGPSNKVDQQ